MNTYAGYPMCVYLGWEGNELSLRPASLAASHWGSRRVPTQKPAAAHTSASALSAGRSIQISGAPFGRASPKGGTDSSIPVMIHSARDTAVVAKLQLTTVLTSKEEALRAPRHYKQ